MGQSQSNAETDAVMGAVEDLIKADPALKFFVTLPNADTFSSYIRQSWENLIKRFPASIESYVNLGDLNYLSLMKYVDVVLGNSSSGILEAPFLGKAVVDVGRRQEGRLRSGHILSVPGDRAAIVKSVTQALSSEFQKPLEKVDSIYGAGNGSQLVYDILKKQNFPELLFKRFYDGDVNKPDKVKNG